MPTGSTRPLNGVRVVERSSTVPAAIAGMLFADFGAEVHLVAGADNARATDPGFAMWDRGKAPASERDADADRADVIITDEHEPPELRGTAVGLHLTPFADHLPWRHRAGGDVMLAATTGVSLRQASFDGGPIDGIVPVLATIHGVWGTAAAIAALYERERSGQGQLVTVAGVHAAMVASAAAFNCDENAAPAPRSAGGPGGSIPFYRTYRCSDGQWLFLAALTPRFTDIAFEVLGVRDLYDDPRLDGRGRAGLLVPANAAWAIERIAEVFATRTRDAWLAALAEAGCPAGPVLDRDGWLDHPQIGAIGMRVVADDPARGRVEMPGTPIHLSTSAAARSAGSPSDHRPALGAGQGPLAGVRVLDLGAIIAGPFAASLLADLGADVIKVEPLTGDSFRGPGFAAYNKGQRGIAVDLQHPAGHDVFVDLARAADVVVDNYRPGVLRRLRLTWEDLVAVNPSIISASITGFGDGGPLGDAAGFDPVLQAMSGMMSAQGGDSDPVFYTVPVNDVTTAATTALGVVLALFHRARTGEAHKVSASLAATSTLLQASDLVRFADRPPPAVGGRDFRGPSAADRYYQTADGWVRVQAPTFDALRVVAGGDIDAWAAATTTDAVLKELHEAGIAAAAARGARELVRDERLLAYDVSRRDPRPGRESFWTTGRHVHFSRTHLERDLVAPSLGEHTREVLAEGGYTDARIDALLDAGVVGAPGARQ